MLKKSLADLNIAWVLCRRYRNEVEWFLSFVGTVLPMFLSFLKSLGGFFINFTWVENLVL